jgi:hypothetical protein
MLADGRESRGGIQCEGASTRQGDLGTTIRDAAEAGPKGPAVGVKGAGKRS